MRCVYVTLASLPFVPRVAPEFLRASCAFSLDSFLPTVITRIETTWRKLVPIVPLEPGLCNAKVPNNMQGPTGALQRLLRVTLPYLACLPKRN
jgi:hypothetical protein